MFLLVDEIQEIVVETFEEEDKAIEAQKVYENHLPISVWTTTIFYKEC